MCSEGKEMGLLGEAKLFWEKERVTRTQEKEGEGVGASCVCVYITAWNTIRYIHVCSYYTSVQNMALLIVHTSILVFTCSVCMCILSTVCVCVCEGGIGGEGFKTHRV